MTWNLYIFEVFRWYLLKICTLLPLQCYFWLWRVKWLLSRKIWLFLLKTIWSPCLSQLFKNHWKSSRKLLEKLKSFDFWKLNPWILFFVLLFFVDENPSKVRYLKPKRERKHCISKRPKGKTRRKKRKLGRWSNSWKIQTKVKM